MKKIVIIAIFIFINVLKAQVNYQGNSSNVIKSEDFKNGIWVTNNVVPRDVKGTPYLFSTWNNKSQVYIKDKAYTMPSFNYNIRSERFEVKISKDSIFIVNPMHVTKVVVNNKVFKRYLDPEFQRNSFFEEMINMDGISLVKKYNVDIKEGATNPMNQRKLSPDRFIKHETFYFLDNENKLKIIKLKKSTVLNLVNSEKRESVKDYSKENKLSFKKIDDVVKMLQYYKTI